MKDRIYTLLIFGLTTFTIFAQETTIDSVLKNDFLEAGWKFSKLENRYVEFELSDIICSTKQQYKIIRRFAGLSDNVTKTHYSLVRTQFEDTTKLLTSEYRDTPKPNLRWISSDYLIYEEREFSNNKIHLRNLRTNEIEFSVSGVIPVDSIDFEKFFDAKNKVLIFFRYADSEKKTIPDLMSFKLSERKVEKLITFDTPFDFEIPVVKLDSENRSLKVKNGNFSMHELQEVEIKY